ncbi:DUF3888 domain-containing protein [Peribacillus simplex]|uniref:DUF3888 domain-containing protein n=2 Tax=Peribacillus TaxID=2675229 RepID=A0AA90P6T0_9BACI|nr:MULTISPECIES: DUF3888 domain-containing protein [Peribacillus]MDP1421703.1 DUF3888 domain-containing protein [Peribacillus simplex]MDP1454373.1 DUF3888 domain-containing protein [Peribacillus frigoritolerans]
MKKLLVLAILMVSISLNNVSVSAEKQHKHDSEGMEQAMDHFILDQFSDEMVQAVKDFYKKDSVRIQYNWWDKNYDVVELDQSEKGRELSHPYIIKFTVITYDGNKTGQLGTDTITFGVSPLQSNKELDEKNLAATKVELLNYSHGEPAKGKK